MLCRLPLHSLPAYHSQSPWLTEPLVIKKVVVLRVELCTPPLGFPLVLAELSHYLNCLQAKSQQIRALFAQHNLIDDFDSW
jgi:hypothetical protein